MIQTFLQQRLSSQEQCFHFRKLGFIWTISRAVVFGGGVTDGFVMGQHLLGAGVRVMVTSDELEHAREALAAIGDGGEGPHSGT